MDVVGAYRAARRDEEVARLRRGLALRAMLARGMTQTAIARELGITQPAVSQQAKAMPDFAHVHPALLVEVAAPMLKELAEQHGYRRMAVFGSVARREAGEDSDIDLVVEAPPEASTFDFVRFKIQLEEFLGRPIDLIDYAALKPGLDDDITREAVLL